MALLPNYIPIVAGSANNPGAVNTSFTNLYSLLGTASGAATFSDANVASGAAINPAKISGTAMVLASAGTQTVSKATAFSAETLTSSLGLSAATYTGGTLFTSVTSTVAAPDMIVAGLGASTLTTTLRGIVIEAWGTNVTTSQTPALSFGGTNLVTKVTTAGTANWLFRARVFRTGLNAQLFIAEAFNSTGTTVSGTDGATVLYNMAVGTLAITETSGITVKMTNTAGTNANITQKGMVIYSL